MKELIVALGAELLDTYIKVQIESLAHSGGRIRRKNEASLKNSTTTADDADLINDQIEELNSYAIRLPIFSVSQVVLKGLKRIGVLTTEQEDAIQNEWLSLPALIDFIEDLINTVFPDGVVYDAEGSFVVGYKKKMMTIANRVMSFIFQKMATILLVDNDGLDELRMLLKVIQSASANKELFIEEVVNDMTKKDFILPSTDDTHLFNYLIHPGLIFGKMGMSMKSKSDVFLPGDYADSLKGTMTGKANKKTSRWSKLIAKPGYFRLYAKIEESISAKNLTADLQSTTNSVFRFLEEFRSDLLSLTIGMDESKEKLAATKKFASKTIHQTLYDSQNAEKLKTTYSNYSKKFFNKIQ